MPFVNLFVIPCDLKLPNNSFFEYQLLLLGEKFVSDQLRFKFFFGEKIAL